jgi:hypothetical protein
MQRTLEEQVAKKCVHFTGLIDKVCKAGVTYDTVKDKTKRPFGIPCIQTGGECPLSKFRTPEEVAKYLDEIAKIEAAGIGAYITVKTHFSKTKQRSGKLKCSCGGELNYVVSNFNDHIWARCSSCGIAFNE